ncbi:MAG TPA: trehalose-phosphatase [Herpetosiphonaceae bacterium]
MTETLLRQMVARRPCGLLTDIDGTLSPIAPTPMAARVTPAARRELRLLAQKLDLVAAISGRAAADAAALVDLPDLIYIGNHGLEIWRGGAAEPLPEAVSYARAVDAVLRAAQERIALPGMIFENKGLTASIHYRLTDDPALAETMLGALLHALAEQHNVVLTQGRMVWEIRPPLATNKGTAARWLVEQYGLRSAIFIGDDRTDADAFQVLRELRERGACKTLNVGVAALETPPIVHALSDMMVEGVAGVERLLAQFNAIFAAEPLS